MSPVDKPLPEWVGQAVPYEYGEVMRSVWLAGARLVLDRMEAENERYRIALAAIYNRLPPSGDYSKPQIVSGMLYDISSLAFNALKSPKEKP